MKNKGIFRFLIFNLRIGLILGVAGLLIYLFGNVFFNTPDKLPIYYAYDFYNNKAQFIYYGKHWRNIDLLLNYYDSTSSSFRRTLRVGGDFEILPINSPLNILDTLKGDVIKFKGTHETYDSSSISFVGYTYIMNIHSVKALE